MTEPKVGQKIELRNIRGDDTKIFKEGQIVTFEKSKKVFGKVYWKFKEHEKYIEVNKIQ